MICRECGSEQDVRNGKVVGVQRYKCKGCGFQFPRETALGLGQDERNKTVALCMLELSMCAIAELFQINVSAVLH
jgi:transposase